MSENDQNPRGHPRHTVTLGSSRSSAVNYGVIEFLRVHPVWRVVAAVLGIAFVVVAVGLWVFSAYAGSKITPTYIFPLLFLVVPWLLWVATVSGPDFQLVFPVAQASKERQIGGVFDVCRFWNHHCGYLALLLQRHPARQIHGVAIHSSGLHSQPYLRTVPLFAFQDTRSVVALLRAVSTLAKALNRDAVG